jgi:hypothetical protein
MDTVDRGPFHRMLEKQAFAIQAQTGESYESAFTKAYCDPSNKSIVDNARLNHLEQSHDAMFGTRLSAIPVAKAAASYDPLRKAAEIAESYGPAHARMHSLAVDHSKAHAMTYAQAYTHVYSRVENEPLRNAVKSEHMRASMAGVQDQGEMGKVAPADEVQDDVPPGSANQELHELVVTRMKREPNLTYQRAFVHEYLAPANRSLKQRYDAESDAHMRRLEPVPAFPKYGDPGDLAGGGRIGRTVGTSGAKPRGYAGG